ncbi:MAG: alcohol dehydrogenase catalytic domain-containing protein [Planctomycetes bacterium]|nr:alcohol dehydrogenase catalytic domain-containing protein [Planctomycetota bacterium]
MKAMMLTGILQMEGKEWSDLLIVKNDDVLLKIKSVGMCGSDVHYYETGCIGSQTAQINKYRFFF